MQKSPESSGENDSSLRNVSMVVGSRVNVNDAIALQYSKKAASCLPTSSEEAICIRRGSLKT